MTLNLSIILLFINIVAARYLIMGPAMTRILRFENCPEYKNLPLDIQVTTQMKNSTFQTFNIFANITELSNDIKVSLRSQKIDNLNSKTIPFSVENTGLCFTVQRFFGELLKDIEDKVGKNIHDCPIKEGIYEGKDISFDLTRMKVQAFLEGTFRTKIILKNSTDVVLCVETDTQVLPLNY